MVGIRRRWTAGRRVEILFWRWSNGPRRLPNSLRHTCRTPPWRESNTPMAVGPTWASPSRAPAHCLLQCVAVCCSVLQCVAVCCSVLQSVTMYCSVLQSVAVCCSVLHSVTVRSSVLPCVAVGWIEYSNSSQVWALTSRAMPGVLQCVATCFSELQCVATCCNMLQCVAMVAVFCSAFTSKVNIAQVSASWNFWTFSSMPILYSKLSGDLIFEKSLSSELMRHDSCAV